MVYHLLMSVPLLAMLLLAAVQDVRTRRIPNWLTFTAILDGMAQSFLPGSAVTPTHALLGFVAGFTLPFILFALGALGGGDVKLFAGVGVWIGPMLVIQSFALAAIVGLVIVLAQAAYTRRLGRLFRNSAVLVINLAHVREVGLDHVSDTGRGSCSIDKPLPYAVPILLGTLGSMALHAAGRSLL